MQPLLDLLAGRGDGLELDRAALELARIEYPNLETEPFIGILDSHAIELAERVAGLPRPSDYVAAANRYLFGELGFKGNSANYHDPRNSCLNDVLTARTGIPITLAVVYLEIARRLARPVSGIGLPGHFLVEYRDAECALYIDVFNGGRLLTSAECFDLAREATGAALPDDPLLLAPAGKRQIVTRILHNLCGVYLLRRAYRKAVRTLDLLLLADPAGALEYRRRGVVHAQMRNFAAAHRDLEMYLQLAPDAPDRSEVEKHVRALRSRQASQN